LIGQLDFRYFWYFDGAQCLCDKQCYSGNMCVSWGRVGECLLMQHRWLSCKFQVSASSGQRIAATQNTVTFRRHHHWCNANDAHYCHLRASVQLSQTEIHVSRHIKRASGATSKSTLFYDSSVSGQLTHSFVKASQSERLKLRLRQSCNTLDSYVVKG
jgi:hypothetical protein